MVFPSMTQVGPAEIKLRLKGKEYTFANAEAAFQAMKYWPRAGEFSRVSGERAFRMNRRLREEKVKADMSYAGTGGNWLETWCSNCVTLAIGGCHLKRNANGSKPESLASPWELESCSRKFKKRGLR